MTSSPTGRLAKQLLLTLCETTDEHKLEILLADQGFSDLLLDFPSKSGEIDAFVLDRGAGFVFLMLLF